MKKFSIALLVVSDRASSGERLDKCEEAVRRFLAGQGHTLASVSIVADEASEISRILAELADAQKYDLILTAGGTGVSPRDVTPEATRPLLDREIPGIPEAMRAASLKITVHAALSRGVAGLRGTTMIVNLPGSPKAAVENLTAVFGAITHGVAKAGGDTTDCAPTGGM